MNRPYRFIAGMTLTTTVLLLTACSGLRSDAPAEQIYVLHAGKLPGAMEPVSAVLSVPRPQVQPGLDTNRIALTRPTNEMDYFAASRWGETLPKVLEAMVLESVASSGIFTTVLGETHNAGHVDYELLLTARHFEATYAAANSVPRVQVTLECVLTSGMPRQVLGRCDAEAVEPASANRMSDIVAALERAAQRALAEVQKKAAALARAPVKK
jgi:cholesterol transport system auxiliary component